MFCEKCGKELKNGALFCEFCGTKVSQSGNPNMQMGGYNQYQGNTMGNGNPNMQMGAYVQNGNPVDNKPKKKSHKGAIIACVLVVTLSVCGVGSFFGYRWYQGKKLETALETAAKDYKDEKYKEAISEYEKALKLDKENDEAKNGKKKAELGLKIANANKLVKAGKYEEAISAFDKILEDNPDNEDAINGKKNAQDGKKSKQLESDLKTAKGYLDSGDYDNAISSFQTILSQHKDNKDAKEGITKAYNAKVDADIAASDFEKANTDAQDALNATGDSSFQTRIDNEIAPNIVPTAEELCKAANDALTEASSIETNIAITQDYDITSSSANLSTTLKSDGKLVYQVAGGEYTLSENVNVSANEKSKKFTNLYYSDAQGKGYAKMDGSDWKENDKLGKTLTNFEAIYKGIPNATYTLSENTENIDGKECYVITTDLPYSEAKDLGKIGLLYSSFTKGVSSENCTATVKIYISKETKEAVQEIITVSGIDASGAAKEMNSALKVDDVNITFKSMEFKIDFTKVGELEKVDVPEGF